MSVLCPDCPLISNSKISGHPDLAIKVETYSIHGSLLKLEYLKTELNEDSDTYAIVKVTSHSYRIMVNLSINDYFEVMRQQRHP